MNLSKDDFEAMSADYRRRRGRLSIYIGISIGLVTGVIATFLPDIATWSGDNSSVVYLLGSILRYMAFPLSAAFLGVGLLLIELSKPDPGSPKETGMFDV